MLRVVRPMMGQISYFFEKYFDKTSLVWTLVFMAMCTSVLAVVAVKIAENLWKKKHEPRSFLAAGFVISAVMSRPIDYLMYIPFTWVSLLQRAMSNFLYVLSFDSNRKIFLDALGLADSEYNQDRLFRIAFLMDDSQWNAVLDNAGDSGWYFAKIQKTIYAVTHFWGQHLSISVSMQGLLAFIPVLATVVLGLFLFFRKKRISGAVVIACGISGIWSNFGTTIYTFAVICGCLLFWYVEKLRIRKPCKRTGDGIVQPDHQPDL